MNFASAMNSSSKIGLISDSHSIDDRMCQDFNKLWIVTGRDCIGITGSDAPAWRYLDELKIVVLVLVYLKRIRPKVI